MEDSELIVEEPSCWSKFHHMFEVGKNDLLRLESEPKLKIIRQIIKNPKFDDVDLYHLTKFELQNSTKVCGISAFVDSNKSPKPERVGSKQPRSDRDYGDEENARTKRRMNNMASGAPPDQQPPKLPAKLKELYKHRKVSKAVLVIQKTLYSTDVSPGHCRLSMPLSQISNKEFISREEKDLLNSRTGKQVPHIEAKLIEPADDECRVYDVNLKKWDMITDSGKVYSIYNLVRGWNDFVKMNGLCKGVTVQLWAFRVDSELWFSLLRV
ncbi:hypothetical protein CsSME_00048932 [Camellia sinensis var. sinensis]